MLKGRTINKSALGKLDLLLGRFISLLEEGIPCELSCFPICVAALAEDIENFVDFNQLLYITLLF